MKQAKNVVLTISEKLTIETMVMIQLEREKEDLIFYESIKLASCTKHTKERIEELKNILYSLNKEHYDLLV